MARMRSPSRSSTALRRLRASSSRRVVSRWRSRVAWSASWLALNCSTTVSTWSFMWSIAAWTSAAWLRRRASFCAGVWALATLTPTPARATPATSSRPSTERALRRPRTIERAAGRPLRRWGGRRTTCNSGLLSGWGICSGGGQRVPQGWFWTICRTGGLGGWRAQPYRRLGLMTNRGPRRAGQTGAEAGKMERRAVALGGRDRPRAAEVARMIQRARGTRAGPCGSGAGSAHEVLRCCGGARRDPPAVVARRAGDAPVDRLVAVDHVGDVEVFGHPLAAELGLQLVDLDDRPGQLLDLVADEAGHPVLDHLRHRAAAQGDHGRAAGHRLDHHDPERLVPLDREDQAAGACQQILLLLGVGLAEPFGVGAQQGAHALFEVALLGGLVALGGDHDRVAGLARRLDRQVRGLLRADPPEEQAEVLLLLLERVLVHRDGVVDAALPGQVGSLGALPVGDGHQAGVAREHAVADGHFAGDRAVRRDHRGLDPPARGQGAGQRVVVHHVDVEVCQVVRRRQRVDHFGERLAHALERRLAIGLQELRTAVGLPGSYQDDLVAASGEAFDQGVHH